MSPETFLEHFETFAAAPNGVARLRELILQLAVQGKLVPQDDDDELRHKDMTVGDFVELQNGYAFKSEWFIANGIRLLRNANVSHGVLDWSDGVSVTEDRAKEFERFALYEGDIVISLDRPIISTGLKSARVTASDLPCLLLQRVGRVQFRDSRVLPEYFSMWLTSPAFMTAIDPGRSNGVPHISSKEIHRIPFTPPSVETQRRIVGKVDQLLGLCDELASRQESRRAARERLVVSTLDRLVRANRNAPTTLDENPQAASAEVHQRSAQAPAEPRPTGTDMASDIERLRAHFDQLFETPPTIPHLRQAILQLAVQGQLVPQDPNEGDVRKVIHRAIEKRQQTIETKSLQRKKLVESVTGIGREDIPSSWCIERLANLVDPENTISYGVLVPGNDVPDGIPFVRAQDLCLSNHPARPNKTIAPEIERPYARTRLTGGEILLCVVGSIGKLGTVPDTWAGANIARAVARIKPIPEVLRDYLLIVLQAKAVQSYFTSTTRTLAQPTLNVGMIEQTPIPIPPLSEQKRIVAKVTELLSLCDALEAKLTQAESASSQLLTAAVHHLLNHAVETVS